jgi:hypothetical protein
MEGERFESEGLAMIGELFEDRVGSFDSFLVLLELVLGLKIGLAVAQWEVDDSP